MQYTFKIEDWETTVTVETDNVEVLEKLSAAVFAALEEEDEEEDEEE